MINYIKHKLWKLKWLSIKYNDHVIIVTVIVIILLIVLWGYLKAQGIII